ncbi:MAG: hypothetical protein M1837_000882 [Sclerophora amabilis]|nr:MAG: hypothetical protein M1837_000882 [Sclerophora amabilis]
MGACAIWSMHFIGNRAIVISEGEPELQIAYNSGFTVLSFFLPILVLVAAFRTTGCSETVSKIRVGLGGVLAGLAICGMHYLGQAGIDRYSCVYQIPYVVGSVIVAIVASVTALTIFFVLRAAWTNSWWKRGLSALLLAGAVSGMHWVASKGTQYRLVRIDAVNKQTISRDQTIIIVLILSMSTCVVLLGLAIVAQRRRTRSANKAQQVVLACVTFDPDGRLMVSPEGLLPSQKITNSYVEGSFDDIFNTSHPVFLWIFRVSRNWLGVADLIPSMRRHLHSLEFLDNPRSSTQDATSTLSNEDDEQSPGDYSMIFRELFCVAASELAEQISEPLENLGVLYDEILSTGHTRYLSRTRSLVADIEQCTPAPTIFGRGQLLFSVRGTNKAEAAKMQACGFRFAGLENVVDILARSLQVGRADLSTHLLNMRDYAREERMMEPGVHLGCFAIRANVGGGFEALVQSKAKNRLPTVQLPVFNLQQWQISALAPLNGCTAAECIKLLETLMSSNDLHLRTFSSQLHSAILVLADELPNFPFMDALLAATPIPVPCRPDGGSVAPSQGLLIAFHIIVSIQTQTPGAAYEFSPLKFLRTQQHVYKNTPDHHLFAKGIYQEFDHVLQSPHQPPMSQRVSNLDAPGLMGSRSSLPKRWSGGPPTALERRASIPSRDCGSEKNHRHSRELGGILVSQEISVEIRDLSRDKSDHSLRSMSTVDIEAAELENSTSYIDRLFAICKEGRQTRSQPDA